MDTKLYRENTSYPILFSPGKHCTTYAQITNKTSTHITSKRLDHGIVLFLILPFPSSPIFAPPTPQRRFFPCVFSLYVALFDAAARVLHVGQGAAHTSDAVLVRANPRRPVVVVRLELLRAPRAHVGAAASL